jgi:hypothetical protein
MGWLALGSEKRGGRRNFGLFTDFKTCKRCKALVGVCKPGFRSQVGCKEVLLRQLGQGAARCFRLLPERRVSGVQRHNCVWVAAASLARGARLDRAASRLPEFWLRAPVGL